MNSKCYKGIGASPGIVIGRAHPLPRNQLRRIYRVLANGNLVETEVKRFQNAVSKLKEQLIHLRDELPEEVKEHAAIIDAHILILEDKKLYEETISLIRKEGINAEWAIEKSLEGFRRIFDAMENEYIRARYRDIEYVCEKLLHIMAGESIEQPALDERVILVAHDLSPLETSQLNLDRIMGLVTDVGGKTSHTAIIAKSLDIPSVVGLENISSMVAAGDLLIVDGSKGIVIVNPTEEEIIEYEERREKFEQYKMVVLEGTKLPSETKDGQSIPLMANIELVDEVSVAREYGAEGIGLYRTEYHYLSLKHLPTEENLFEDYTSVLQQMGNKVVTIRTLDLGADKFSPEGLLCKGPNPALGLRAIRLSLKEVEVFKTQLRAILRASAYGNVRLMFPMISGLEELKRTLELLEEAKNELERKSIPFDRDLKVGIMIEVPSAVAVADLLAKEVDFFSIGTNDLIQYTLAIDRVNEHVAHMYQPYHPAILRLIKDVISVGKKFGIPVAMCGEMAGDPLCTPLLIGLGINELSMNATTIPRIKRMVRLSSVNECKHISETALSLPTAREVHNFLKEEAGQHYPECFNEDGEWLF